MAKTKISELDAAAANNTDINSVDVSEGCAPSGINNAIREMGAMLKRMDNGTDHLTNPNITGDLDVDNININGNSITSTDTNGDITLDPNGTGKVNINGNADLNDNIFLRIGTGNDLQLYHTGTHSYIDDLGTGDLNIRATSALNLASPTGDTYATFGQDGAATLFFDNAAKLATTSTGVETGNVTMTSDDPTITMTDSSGTNDIATIQATSGALIVTARDGGADGEIIFKKTDGSATDETLRITNTGNVGLNTSSPETILHATASSAIIRLTSDSNGTSGVDFGDSADTNIGRLLYNNSDNSMRFTTNAGERMRILSSGGITFNGDTAAANALDSYEEGTFTPALNGEGACTITTSSASGHYTKVGRLVHVNMFFQVSAVSGAGSGLAVELANLPFNTNSSMNVAGSIRVANLGSSVEGLQVIIFNNSAGGRIEEFNGTGGTNLSDHLANNTNFQVTMSYAT